MQANVRKCHVLITTDQKVHVNIGTARIENRKSEKIIEVNIDSKLNFDEHIKMFCSKAQEKINALKRGAPFMNIEKSKLIRNGFINSQFRYCPLTRMFHSRSHVVLNISKFAIYCD